MLALYTLPEFISNHPKEDPNKDQPKEDPKIIWITWQTHRVLLKSAFFHQIPLNFAISRNTDIDSFWYITSNFFHFFWVIKDCFNKYGYYFDDVSKNGEIKVWNKGYDVITFVLEINNKILSRDSNYL